MIGLPKILVTGAGGFIASHLVRYLKERGYWVRGVDIKRPQWSQSEADEFLLLDLRHERSAKEALRDMGVVYQLAADMGGMGFISTNHSTILRNNAMININVAQAAHLCGIDKLFFSSSACVYPEDLQMSEAVESLKEDDAWAGRPDTSYGAEKLFAEEIYRRLSEEHGIEVRIARFHNIYGPEGSWNDGREKLPAAACRKVAIAKQTGDHRVEIWGEGLATRSFCYVDDCIEMVLRLMESGYREPLNVGSDIAVSVNTMFDLAAEAAGIEIEKVHVPGPQGVRNRNADLSIMRRVLGYEPRVSLRIGMQNLYHWVEEQATKTS